MSSVAASRSSLVSGPNCTKHLTLKAHPLPLASGVRRLVHCMARLCQSRSSETRQGASRRWSVGGSTLTVLGEPGTRLLGLRAGISGRRLLVIDRTRPRRGWFQSENSPDSIIGCALQRLPSFCSASASHRPQFRPQLKRVQLSESCLPLPGCLQTLTTAALGCLWVTLPPTAPATLVRTNLDFARSVSGAN
jgi:hypothetical protein